MNNYLTAKYSFILIVMIVFMTSCNSTKFLQDGEHLINKNTTILDSKNKIENKRSLSYELTYLYKQKENTNFLFFFPREWFYFATQDAKDSTSLDRLQRKYIAEVPAVFNDSLTRETANAMRYYLHHKGYYYADVQYETKITRKKINITYNVDPGIQFQIDSVFFQSSDQELDSILQSVQVQTLLKKGVGFDLNLFEAEKTRVSDHLNNNGYAYFYPSFIDKLDVDTFQNNGKANLYLKVLPPQNDSIHKKYTLGNIEIFPDYDPTKGFSDLVDTTIQGYRFFSNQSEFIVKPSTLINSLYIKKGDAFRQKNIDQTHRQLSELGIYRFIRIKEVADLESPDVLNIRIELTPATKMEIGMDFEVNYTNSNSSSTPSDLFGVSLKPSFKNRNLFKGAELFVVDLNAGVEVSPFDSTRFWNTIDASLQTDLYLPKFLDYFGIWKGLHKIPFGKKRQLINTNFYNALRDNSATRISAGYTFQFILDWYRSNLFSASYGYELPRSQTQKYNINHIGIDYFYPKTEPEFEKDILDNNDFLKRSFGKQVFVSLLFKNLDYSFTSRTSRFGETAYVGLSFELAGAEVWGINALYNEFSLNPKILQPGKDIQFSQYFRFESELHYQRKLGTRNQLASRMNIGIAKAFGFTSDVPYVKQFAAGGANSIRAWLPRGLGPGGYLDSLSINKENRNRLYQKGDLRLEFNAEYRFNILGPLNMAVFLDVGNIWTTDLDTTRYGSQFLFNRKCISGCNGTEPELKIYNDAFYQQFAIGTGIGMRMDVSYFVFRLDMGLKLRNPYPENRDENGKGSGYWQSPRKWSLREATFNFGLGYPF
jgi:outer membrane protein assembly factor BamA